jgi:hypothetical protein
MNENKCCATCDRAAQLYMGDTPTVYRFCQLSGAIPHLPHEYCEDYIPKNKKNNEEGQLCETCRYYNNDTYWCSQYNDTTYNPNCSSYQVKEV